jgi:hypothetical protein
MNQPFFYVGKVEETVKYVAAPWREAFFKRDEDAPGYRSFAARHLDHVC